MAGTTVRVSDETHRALLVMAGREGITVSAKVSVLVRQAEDDAMLAGHAAAMDRLGADRDGWAAWQGEVTELDGMHAEIVRLIDTLIRPR